MKRRSFIKGTTTAITGIGLSTTSCTQKPKKKSEEPFKVIVTMDQQKVSFHSEVINDSVKVVHIILYLFMDDERGIPFSEIQQPDGKGWFL